MMPPKEYQETEEQKEARYAFEEARQTYQDMETNRHMRKRPNLCGENANDKL